MSVKFPSLPKPDFKVDSSAAPSFNAPSPRKTVFETLAHFELPTRLAPKSHALDLSSHFQKSPSSFGVESPTSPPHIARAISTAEVSVQPQRYENPHAHAFIKGLVLDPIEKIAYSFNPQTGQDPLHQETRLPSQWLADTTQTINTMLGNMVDVAAGVLNPRKNPNPLNYDATNHINLAGMAAGAIKLLKNTNTWLAAGQFLSPVNRLDPTNFVVKPLKVFGDNNSPLVNMDYMPHHTGSAFGMKTTTYQHPDFKTPDGLPDTTNNKNNKETLLDQILKETTNQQKLKYPEDPQHRGRGSENTHLTGNETPKNTNATSQHARPNNRLSKEWDNQANTLEIKARKQHASLLDEILNEHHETMNLTDEQRGLRDILAKLEPQKKSPIDEYTTFVRNGQKELSNLTSAVAKLTDEIDLTTKQLKNESYKKPVTTNGTNQSITGTPLEHALVDDDFGRLQLDARDAQKVKKALIEKLESQRGKFEEMWHEKQDLSGKVRRHQNVAEELKFDEKLVTPKLKIASSKTQLEKLLNRYGFSSDQDITKENIELTLSAITKSGSASEAEQVRNLIKEIKELEIQNSKGIKNLYQETNATADKETFNLTIKEINNILNQNR